MKKLLLSITPRYIKSKLYLIFLELIKENNKKASSQIPKFNLEKKLIANAQLLLNREELLKKMPKSSIVAELGVDEGKFSESILNICKPKKLHLVDLWGSSRYNEGKKNDVKQKFKDQIDSGQVEINLGYSTEVGGQFEDEYFDWIYIDTDHSYKTTILELEVWSKKIKPDGIIAGHDFIIGNWDGIVRYGVIEAVYEFCNKNAWEIVYITMELDSHPSFAIKKIS
ncbi:class I SAM-dependent methyltransferase [Algoriphagus marinus]|uniref:class I SAM-dependent methyltransferase n=1 Tax=Algoriphagus marinus TaxID=1925762 RepID=UPI00094BA487|nr:class I SAM-dependent methyltransferase [Algoriphagus marinus]